MILVTGVNGFVGKHLVRELAGRGLKVIGLGQRESQPATEIDALLAGYYQCDVTDAQQVDGLPLNQIQAVINLAGLASVGASFKDPALYMKVNVDVLRVIGSALYEKNPKARMIAVSTGALYDPNQPMPLTEESSVIENGSPYAMSKLAMEKAAAELRAKGQDCIIVRPFNHIGPGQGLGFLIPDLANKLLSTDKNSPTITAGNLKTIRDYTDVRDIVKAYADLATAKNLEQDLYNVCSGNGRSGEDILRELCPLIGIDFEKLKINIDQSLIRPNDPLKIVGSHERLSKEISWQPTITVKKTAADIVAELKN